MSHKKTKSLTRQIQETLVAKFACGRSKHHDKFKNETFNRIYSGNTLRNYMKHCNYFTKYCQKHYHCKTLSQCREHVNEFLQSRIDNGYSPFTQKLEASALAKLYGCHTSDFIKTQVRHRADITRSRGIAKRDSHFSEKNNKELVEFCKSTGLRRNELKQITGDSLYKEKDGNYYINVTKGTKGGKPRTTLIVGDIENAVNLLKKAGSKRVFNKIPSGADIHGFRGVYARTVYKKFARDIKDIPEKEKYRCRKDLKGVIYDKKAMRITSNNLGHNRISVIAQSYISHS